MTEGRKNNPQQQNSVNQQSPSFTRFKHEAIFFFLPGFVEAVLGPFHLRGFLNCPRNRNQQRLARKEQQQTNKCQTTIPLFIHVRLLIFLPSNAVFSTDSKNFWGSRLASSLESLTFGADSANNKSS